MIYRKDYIPLSTACDRRPGHKFTPTTITIHNTGNPDSSADNERGWLTNPSNGRTASFHIAVDEHEAVECIPLNEHAWHSGDGSGAKSGNKTSLGIEICESGNYAKTLDNAAGLVAEMLKERGWGVDRLRRHWDWKNSEGNRKVCPRLMYDEGKWKGWSEFKDMVSNKMKEETKVATERDIHQVSAWAESAWEEMTKNGYYDGSRPGATQTREEAAVVMSRFRKNVLKLIANNSEDIAELDRRLAEIEAAD